MEEMKHFKACYFNEKFVFGSLKVRADPLDNISHWNELPLQIYQFYAFKNAL